MVKCMRTKNEIFLEETPLWRQWFKFECGQWTYRQSDQIPRLNSDTLQRVGTIKPHSPSIYMLLLLITLMIMTVATMAIMIAELGWNQLPRWLVGLLRKLRCSEATSRCNHSRSQGSSWLVDSRCCWLDRRTGNSFGSRCQVYHWNHQTMELGWTLQQRGESDRPTTASTF